MRKTAERVLSTEWEKRLNGRKTAAKYSLRVGNFPTDKAVFRGAGNA